MTCLRDLFHSPFSVLMVYKVLLMLRRVCDCSLFTYSNEIGSQGASVNKYSPFVIVLINEVPILPPGRLNAVL